MDRGKQRLDVVLGDGRLFSQRNRKQCHQLRAKVGRRCWRFEEMED